MNNKVADHVATVTMDNDPLLSLDDVEKDDPKELVEQLLREPLLPLSPDSQANNANANANTNDHNDLDLDFTSDPRRFVVLAAYCACSACNSLLSMSMAPIAEAVGDAYGVSIPAVNGLVLSFMVLYGPGTWLASQTIRSYGLGRSIKAGAVANLLAALLRWVSLYDYSLFGPFTSTTTTPYHSFSVLMLGTCISALAQPVFFNTPTRVAAAWFSNHAEATAIALFSSFLGLAVAEAIPPLIVDAQGQGLNLLLMAQVGLNAMTLVFTFWFFESEPVQPPSAAEAARRRHQASHEASSSSSSSLYTDVKRLLQDKDYLVILYAFGVGLAIFNAILTLLPEWIATAGFDDPDVAGNCGGLLVVGGMLSTAVAAPLLDHSRQYATAVRVSFAVALVVSTGTVWMLRPSTSTRMLGLAFAALGAAQLPLLTICLDAVAAHTYPISEEVSSAGLMLVGQYGGVAMLYGMEALLTKDPHQWGLAAPANVLFLGVLATCAIVALFYTGIDARSAVGTTTNMADTTTSRTLTTTHPAEEPLLEELVVVEEDG
jgi:hypothetical protein